MAASWRTLTLCLCLCAGCYTAPVQRNIDSLLCDRAHQTSDLLPPLTAPAPLADADGKPAAGQDGKGKNRTLEQNLQVPAGVPGVAAAPQIQLPGPEEPDKQDAALKRYFPPLPTLGPELMPGPGPDGRPLTLTDLQQLARAHSPVLRQAASDIENAHGAAIQAGLYPNPTIGTQTQTAGPGGGPFYGIAAMQTIKTMGKLTLSRVAAEKDLASARLAYRRAETDLMTQVRSAYFGALVAQEGMCANLALTRLTDEMYRVLVRQLRGGEVAVYEPMQVGVLAAQARASLLTARNSYQLSWKQLASALGLPGMPAVQLEGRADMPVPHYDYARVLAHVLSQHTDVGTADLAIQKARYHLRLAEVTPYPDVNLQTTIQQDATAPGPSRIITMLNASVPVPLFDRNQGTIRQAQAMLLHANEEPHRVRADLTGRVAEAFRRYDENRALLELYRTEILPKQVQAFRAAVKRHYGAEPEKVAYNDLVVSEQTLVNVVGTYLMLLGAQWQAVADVAGLAQTDDVFQLAEGTHPVAAPDLDQLLQLPCCHPCLPVPAELTGRVDGTWLPSTRTLGLGAPVVPAPAVEKAPASPEKTSAAPAPLPISALPLPVLTAGPTLTMAPAARD